MITRRHCLAAAVGLSLSGLRGIASDFWASKGSGQWSEKDIQRLMTHSPWAKEVTVEFKGGPPVGGGMPSGTGRRGRGGGGAPSWDASSSAGMGGNPIGGGGGMAPGGGGGMGSGIGRSGMGGPPERQALPELKTTVRWESSKAIRDGRKKTIHPDDAPFYIVSVGPLPLTGNQSDSRDPAKESRGNTGQNSAEDRRKILEQRLKEVTQLQRKGHDPIVPDRTAVVEGPSARILVFYFPRDPQPIQVDDKEVTFYTALGPMEVRAKFTLKDMMYRSQLEL